MAFGFGAKTGLAVAVLGFSALAGCGGAPGEGGFGVGDALLLAGTSVPPPAPAQLDEVYCPPVTVFDGGAAIQARGSQVALGRLARECVGQPDGSTLVKVGIQGRTLVGPGGGAGRFDVPVQIVVKDGSTVLANRARRAAVAIPAGGTQASFTLVEGNIVVPANAANTFDILVGLGSRRS
jgi:hypothetical protein